jgi:hypothetical protein
MDYQETITISASEFTFINKAMQSKDMMGEDDTLVHTARFADGMEMDVKLCGTQDDTPWTESVLFKDGSEVCCSEPGETYDGPWTLEYGGNTYTATVVMKKPENRKEKKEIRKMTKRTTTTTRVCRQCGGTEFASGYQVSIECIVDGSGRLIRFLETDIEDAREACRSEKAAGPFVCLSCFHKGKTLEEITVAKEHPAIGVCLMEKPGEYGLNGADISRMMQELGEAEVYPVEFPAAGHESSAMGFITAECAEVLEYDYQELAKYIAGILDDMDKETEDGLYLFHGFTIMLSR